MAVRALWSGPPATVVPNPHDAWSLVFSGDGSKLSVGTTNGILRVFSRDLEPQVELRDFEGRGIAAFQSFSPDSDHLVGWASGAGPEVRVWNTREWGVEKIFEIPEVWGGYGWFDLGGRDLVTTGIQVEFGKAGPAETPVKWLVHRWPLAGGQPEFLGSVDATYAGLAVLDMNRGLLAVGMRNEIHIHGLESLGREPPRVIGRHEHDLAFRSAIAFDPGGDRVAVGDSKGNILIWALDGDGHEPVGRLSAPGDPSSTTFSPNGKLLAHASRQGAWLWDLHGPQDADPVRLGLEGSLAVHTAFTPQGGWLATAGAGYGIALWPLESRYCRVLHWPEGRVTSTVFSPDGSRLFAQGKADGLVLSWDLSAGAGGDPTVVLKPAPQWGWGLLMDPNGKFLIASGLGGVMMVPLDGSQPTAIEDFPRQGNVIDPSGRYLAGNRNWDDHPTPIIEFLDLENGDRWEIDPPGEGNANVWNFDERGGLVVVKGSTVSRWDPITRSIETLFEDVEYGSPYPGGRMYLVDEGKRWVVDLSDGSRKEFPLLGENGVWGTDRTGSIVTRTGSDGSVVVWSTSQLEPHLLLGHEGPAFDSWFSPDGKWIATTGADNTIRLWPMPDFSKPPLHTLPRKELIAKLKTLTNLRVVRDEESSTGWKVTVGPFPGWAEVPEW